MTRAEYAREVRRRVESFPPEHHSTIGMMAIDRAVWCWTNLTGEQLDRLLGASMRMQLLLGAFIELDR